MLYSIFCAKAREDRTLFEKNLEINYLLDFYGDVLSERKRTVLEMYYNDDLSLAEIALDIGISRQGVRDMIKKSEEELLYLEEKLGLCKKFRTSKNFIEFLQGNTAFPYLGEGVNEFLQGNTAFPLRGRCQLYADG